MSGGNIADDIEAGLRLYELSSNVFEVRVLKTENGTVSGYFDNPASAARAIAPWDGRGLGVYFTPNAVNPDLLARAHNRLVTYAKHTTADTDIVQRRCLLIDLDPKRPSGISSTDAEHQEALQRTYGCRDLLRGRGWEPALVADSGNGGHIIYRIDLPNDKESEALVRDALAALDMLLSDDRVSVDKTTYNASRIWKVPYTLARKGDSLPERPHRRARILESSDLAELVTAEQLQALAAIIRNATAAEAPTSRAGSTERSSGPYRRFDIDEWISKHNLPVVQTGEWQGGRKFILNPCPWNSEHTNRAAYVLQFPSGAVAAGCHHNGCEGKGWHDLRDHCEPGWRERRQASARGSTPRPVTPSASEPADDEEPPTDAETASLNLTDVGNAERFVRDHGHQLRFCEALRGWLVWDGTRFEANETGQAAFRARATARRMHQDAASLSDEKAQKALCSWAFKSESHARQKAMLALAESDPTVAVRADAFDNDPWVLNTPSGVVNLRTGAVAPHDRIRLLTRVTNAIYDPAATCPLWESFLRRIMGDREDLVRFLKRAAGYALTGSVREHMMLILFGVGQNGKTTFIETLRYVIGDYAAHTPSETFLVKAQGAGIPNDVARLRGARLVTASETEEGRRLAEALVKQVTGGDTITARFMFREFFDFQPQFKLMLATNHKPQIRGTDLGIWRRLRLVPFDVRIPDEEKDQDLGDKLKAEAPGILRWAVEGCLEWQRDGLGDPTDVTSATAEYRREMDVIGDFLEERCVQHSSLSIRSNALYVDYRRWCDDRGESPITQTAFGLRLKERGFKGHRDNKGRIWQGVGLRASPEQEEAA